MADPLYDPARTPRVDPRDAAAIAHAFLRRCRAWGAEREIPDRIRRLQEAPTRQEAAELHAWAAWVEFVDHALREVESGRLDHWFGEADEL